MLINNTKSSSSNPQNVAFCQHFPYTWPHNIAIFFFFFFFFCELSVFIFFEAITNKGNGYIGGSFPLLILIEEKMGSSIENASKHKVGSDPFGKMVRTKVSTS
jgi:hypothetical protein